MSTRLERHLSQAKRFALARARSIWKAPSWIKKEEEDAWSTVQSAIYRHQREMMESAMMSWAYAKIRESGK